jgi:predicted molibdopterin-dependent oxidoreductase YjgC
VPSTKGRSTLEQLSAMAEGTQKALVVLGADPTTDVVDAALVERAFSTDLPLGAVAVHGGPILAHAHVVLPATVMHERGGTTTNLEGRVSRLGQKVVPSGQAWADWMIAAELAQELGADLGVTTTEEVTDQIARLAPSHAGVDRARLEQADAIDGVLVPLSRIQPTISDRIVDPIAVPGITGPTQVGLGSYAGVVRSEDASSIEASGTLLSVVDLAGETALEAPSPDSYALRLVVTRTLYDQGTFVSASPALDALRPASVVKAHPYDLDRLGASDGSEVTLRSARATVVVTVVADEGVLKGTVVIDAALASPSATGASLAAALLSADDLVTEVRMESL